MNTGLPTLIETAHGNTIEYRSTFLYSKVAPQKTALRTADALTIPTETLVLCVSPLLGYGLSILLDKLPQNSLILGLEADESLMDLSVRSLNPKILDHPGFHYIRTQNIEQLQNHLPTLKRGPFRRCIRVDLSAGARLYSTFYSQAFSLISSYISDFWKNRITLINLGRNYAKNIFRNIPLLLNAQPLNTNTITKPVFIVGSGPSALDSIPLIQKYREQLFVCAVDTSRTMLEDAYITPDACILVESQFWIEASFVGLKSTSTALYTDLTARPEAIKTSKGDRYFFLSDYYKSQFLHRLMSMSLAPLTVPPLGSVGIVASVLARYITKPTLPIFISGLDFSWSTGFTHAQGTQAVKQIYNQTHRFNPVANSRGEAREGTIKTTGIDDSSLYTNPALENYARITSHYAQTEILYTCFDLRSKGLPIGLPRLQIKEFEEILNRLKSSHLSIDVIQKKSTQDAKSAVLRQKTREALDFLKYEQAMLIELKNILTHKTKLTQHEAAIRTKELIVAMDYLYIHFPDGHKPNTDSPAFLNRVRVEINVFLKTIANAIKDVENLAI